MTLSQKFSSSFATSIRDRGATYWRQGKVYIIDSTERRIDARVRGSESYKVILELQGRQLRVSCTCPYFDEDFCKHLWATLLEADRDSYFASAAARAEFLEFADGRDDEDGYDDFDDDDVYDDYRGSYSSQRRYRKPAAKPAAAPPAPPASKLTDWSKSLNSISEQLRQVEMRSQNLWSRGREAFYIVDVPATLQSQGLIVETWFRDRKKNGEWGKLQRLNLSKDHAAQLPNAIEQEIGARLLGAASDLYSYGYYNNASRFKLYHPAQQEALRLMSSTGRCYLKVEEARHPQAAPELEPQPLHWDDGVWEFALRIRRDEASGDYRVTGVLRREEEEISLTQPVLMVAGGLLFWSDRIAALDDHGAFAWMSLLRREGELWVPAAERDAFFEKLILLPALPRLDLPDELRYEEATATPVPVVKILAPSGRFYDLLPVQLYFQYGDFVLQYAQLESGIFDRANRQLMHRDQTFEEEAYGRLKQLGCRSRYDYAARGSVMELSRKHLPRLVKALLQEGWRVEAEGKLYRQPGKFSLQVASGIDWFDVSGAMQFGDTFASLPALLDALRRGEDTVLLDDGTFGLLPEEWLKKYGVLAGLGEREAEGVRFRRSQAGLLDALLASQPEATFDEGFRRAREELASFAGVEAADAPPGFVGTLRGYQRDALGWFGFLQKFGFGGCLADDMGLGKCLAADSLIAVNGELLTAETIWSRYAASEMFDGEGYWATPGEALSVSSLDETGGRMVQSRIRRLYRQRVCERLRTITLEDGSRVTVTKRHRLLTDKGWTNELRVGDYVCVPGRLPMEGKPECRDLLKLLAWQIAEGYELRDHATVKISQKDVTVLEDLQETVQRLGKTLALKFGEAKIHRRANRVADLTINSTAYRRYLENRGYTWGKLSREKQCPAFLLQADNESVRVFLQNFFEAEAAVCLGMRSIEISSASWLLMQQLSHLLRRFGIWMRISTRQKHATNGSGIYRSYAIGVIGGNAARRFCKEIGFASLQKQRRLEEVCAYKGNTNVEGIPASAIMAEVVSATRLPARHFGLHNTVYLNGSQQFSRASLERVVDAFDKLISGEAESEYRQQKRSKWTEHTLAAYAQLPNGLLVSTRNQLQKLLQQEVFYCRLKTIEETGYDGWVYDFEIETHHNFIANGILCHNTIQVLSLLEARRELRETQATEAAAAKTGKAGKRGKKKAAANKSRRTGDEQSAAARRVPPSLVVVPKSLVFNWQQEAARFTPQLRVLDHTGGLRRKSTEHFDDYDLIVTTYGTLRKDALQFKDFQFDYVILDESQAIKNAATESAKAARLLRGDYRLALSGTPIENHLGELWSLFEFLNPGLLGNASVFKLTGAGGRTVDEETRELLAKGLRPFILRRTKEQVAKDLPEKLEQTIYCELDKAQRKLYDELRDHYRAALLGRIAEVGIKRSKIQVLEALLRLRQAACHPGLLDKKRLGDASAKLDLLVTQLEELHEEGHKTLVFSQFTSFLAIVRNRLDADGVAYEYLDGRTRDRQSRVERFQQDPDCKLFLISLKAGGLGLNLTAAEYVFLLDPWWNPAVEAQAIDRAHRIGQTQKVFAYRLIARDTVEEKVLELQNTKRNLAEAIINADNSLIRDLNREDLELLLS